MFFSDRSLLVFYIDMRFKFCHAYNFFSMLSFFLLFPGFFFYHYAVARGFLPPLLGGFFSYVAIPTCLLLIFLSGNFIANNIDGVSVTFFSAILLIFFVALYNYAFGKPNGWSDEMLLWSLSGVLFNIVCYLTARGFNVARSINYINFAFVSMATIVVLNIGDFGIFYVMQEAGDAADHVATYQGFGRSLVVVGLILISYYLFSTKLFCFVFAIGLVAIFFNGARSEFAAFVATVLLVYFVYSLRSKKHFLFFTLFFLVALFAIYLFLDKFPESRMLELLEIGTSSSGQIRSSLLIYGMSVIYDNPITGCYGKYVRLGGIGYFPHNIFSAWVNLGLIGFAIYICLFFVLWQIVLKNFKVHKLLFEFKIFLVFLVFVTFLIFSSKDYSYMLIGFLVGLYSRYQDTVRVRCT